MGIFDKIREPVILKEESSAKEQLKEMQQLLAEVIDPKMKALLEHDIAAVNAGIFGENIIIYELKNSHIPMFVLHDLYLEHEGLSAQIDFLVITRKRNFVIECKNLYGNITINNNGDFVRTVGNKQEGIYSPATQGKRHLELIKQIRSAQRNNFLTKAIFEHNFYENYRSVIVLANPKTVLNAKYAKKEIKEQVIRADQLIEHIKKVNTEPEAVDSSESAMKELADFFLANHRVCKTDHLEKYRKAIQSVQDEPVKVNMPQQSSFDISGGTVVILCPNCGATMVKRKATKGENAGREFWGCSNFPQCRGIINL
jgi:predicted RNA-binding Zn-ribbon protein involved in translation (DUF1610 family)